MVTMTEKIKKTLYIPSWIAEWLDSEGAKHDGPGVVVSAAIYAFCKQAPGQRVTILQSYRNEEVVRDYAAADEQAAHESSSQAQKHKSGRRSSKAG